jgi:hypothetical protein
MSSERTLRLIIGYLKDNPAYLLLLAIGLLGGGMGVGATVVGTYHRNFTLQILGFVTWALLLLATLLVIRIVEPRRYAGNLPLYELPEAARNAFLDGPSAEHLSGLWHVRWYEGEGKQKKPYDYDPEEQIQVETEGCSIQGSAYDPSTKKTYFMHGRLSDDGIVTLIYWSTPDMGIKSLVGVVLLKYGQSWDPERENFIPVLSGSWRGFDRGGRIVMGEVEWTYRG